MFTGIIEALGEVLSIQSEGSNMHFEISTNLSDVLKVDQSIAHNGVCLTVTNLLENKPDGEKRYFVTAIDETLKKSNLGSLQAGDKLNIERCMKVGDRLDGHFVQGHVDATGTVEEIRDENGSWIFRIKFPEQHQALLVEKGSICINGTSLTVLDCQENAFSVAIIPFTYEHTSFQSLKVGDPVNLEFDILGKYILKNATIQGLV